MSGGHVDWDLTVEVFVPTRGGNGNVATGFPIAKDRIITAAHVFGQQETAVVRWFHGDKAARRSVAAEGIVWDGREGGFDVVVRALPRIGLLRQADKSPEETDSWKGSAAARQQPLVHATRPWVA